MPIVAVGWLAAPQSCAQVVRGLESTAQELGRNCVITGPLSASLRLPSRSLSQEWPH